MEHWLKCWTLFSQLEFYLSSVVTVQKINKCRNDDLPVPKEF